MVLKLNRGLLLFLLFLICIPLAALDIDPSSGQYVRSHVLLGKQKSLKYVWVKVADNPQEMEVEVKPFVSFLKDFLTDELMDKLTGNIPEDGMLKLSALKAFPIEVQFDELSLNLQVIVPAKYVKAQTVYLSRRGRQDNQASVESRPFWSSFLNLRGKQHFDDQSGSYDRDLLEASGHWVANLGGLIFENKVSYHDERKHVWRRDESRIVYDMESSLIRLELGDFRSPVVSYQSSIDGAGLSFTRVFEIDPDYHHSSFHAPKLYLEEPAIVEIHVNQRLYKKLHLDAGPVFLKDFPLHLGRNNIVVKVISPSGEIEELDYFKIRDPRILDKGLADFHFSGSVEKKDDHWYQDYDYEKWNAKAYLRYGATESLMLGANAQVNEVSHLYGLESLYAHSWGFFGLEGAHSFLPKDGDHGFAAKFRYNNFSIDRSKRSDYNLNLTAEYLSPYFKDPKQSIDGLSVNPNKRTADFSAFVSQNVSSNFRAGVGLRHTLFREGDPQETSLTSHFSLRLEGNWRLGMVYRRTLESRTDESIFFSLNWYESHWNQQLFSHYNPMTDNAFTYYRFNPLTGSERLETSLGWTHNEFQEGLSFDSEYSNQRLEILTEHDSQFPTQNSAPTKNHSAVGFGTALVFAGDRVAISKPVVGSFALVDLENRPSGVNLAVNKFSDHADGEVNWLGPAVLTHVSPYRTKKVSLDSAGVPIGTSLEKDHFTIRPGYLGGALVKGVAESKVAVSGYLFNARGEKHTLSVLALVDVKTKKEVKSFFSDHNGRFFIEDVPSGKFLIKTLSGQFSSSEIVIGSKDSGIKDLGDIKLK